MAQTKTKKRKRRPDQFFSKALSTKKIVHQDFSQEQILEFSKLLSHDKNIFNENKTHENSILIGFDEVGRGPIAGPVCTGAYSCSSFYSDQQELLQEIKFARQIISDELLKTNDRDSYYAETLCNDFNIAQDLEQLEKLSQLLNLEDSKKVSKNKREKLVESLKEVPCFEHYSHLFFTSNFESAQSIDEIGIVECIWVSMSKNLANIISQYYDINNFLPDEIILLVDGPKTIKNLENKLEKLNPSFKKIELKQIAIKKGDSKSSLIAAAANIAKLERDAYMTKIAQDYNDYHWANNAGYGTKKHYAAINNYGLCKEHRKSYLRGY